MKRRKAWAEGCSKPPWGGEGGSRTHISTMGIDLFHLSSWMDKEEQGEAYPFEQWLKGSAELK